MRPKSWKALQQKLSSDRTNVRQHVTVGGGSKRLTDLCFSARRSNAGPERATFHFAAGNHLLQDVITRRDGAIIKTIGDAVMATFLQPSDAVAAALAMRKEIATFNAHQPDRALILKIGIHKGAAIAVTLNERLDYFVQTVNIAARVQQLADAGEIFISEDVHSAENVQQRLGSEPVRSNIFKLKGVQQDLRVFCIPKEPANRGEVEVT